MNWSDDISRQLDAALIRLDVLCRVYELPREPENPTRDLDDRCLPSLIGEIGHDAGGMR